MKLPKACDPSKPSYKHLFVCFHCRASFEEVKMCGGVCVFIHLADVYELIYLCELSVNWLDIALKWYGFRVSSCSPLILTFF